MRRRLRNRYRLVILKDYDLAEKASFSIRGANIVAFFSIILVVTFVLFWVLFSFTPLMYLLPVSDQIQKEKQLTKLAKKTDSLNKVIENQRSYFNNIKTILKGKVPDSGKKALADSDKENLKSRSTPIQAREDLQQDSLLKPGIDNRSDINLLPESEEQTSTISLEELTFFPPLEGLITSEYDGSAGHYAVDVVAPANSEIKATKDGTVIYTGWSATTGYTMVIQHKANLISVYKHNSELLRNVGSFVKAGESIGIVGTSGKLSTGPHLHFELWQNGTPVDPEVYINFD